LYKAKLYSAFDTFVSEIDNHTINIIDYGCGQALATQDIIIDNSNITLYLFSNILDVEFFKLDKDFLDKIANSQNRLNYFLSVSPNINEKRNSRLDIFYQYFKDNFKAELISYRFDNLNNNTRYERIFKTKVINETSKI